MKVLLKFSLIVIALATLFTSCEREDSDSVDQDLIYANYELYYNANTDITYARATFRFSNALGTKLELTNPSEIRFNGDTIPWKPLLAYYEKELNGYVPNGTFEWIDTDGLTFTNDITIKSIDYPSNFDSLSISSAYEFFWVGDTLDALESVTMTINGENEGDVQVFTTVVPYTYSMNLELNKLSQLGTGPGTIYLDRRNTPVLSQKTSAGGVISGRYRPLNHNILIVD